MLHTHETDCFLTCRLCNLCLKIDQEHHCDNLPVSLKIKYCDKSCERCKSIRDNQKKMSVGFIQTEMRTSAATVDGAR